MDFVKSSLFNFVIILTYTDYRPFKNPVSGEEADP